MGDETHTETAPDTTGSGLRSERDRPSDADTEPVDVDAGAVDRRVDRHGARAALYGGLAGAFCYPDADTVAELRAPAAATGLREAGRKLGYEAEVETLCGALATADREALETTYTELFGLPDGGTYSVVPYEATHTVQGGVGRTQRRIATVAGLLSALDLEVATDFHERPDHLAIELEVMQVLAAKRAVALDERNHEAAATLERAEATVLGEHLVQFVPSFANDLRATTDDPVYTAAADLAERLVVDDDAVHPDPVSPSPDTRAGSRGEPR